MANLPFIYDLEISELKAYLRRTWPAFLSCEANLAGAYTKISGTRQMNSPTSPKPCASNWAQSLRFEALSPYQISRLVRRANAQDPFPTPRQSRDRSGADEVRPIHAQGTGSPHIVYFVPGGLRNGLRFLRHRADGLQAPSYQRRDRCAGDVLCAYVATTQDEKVTNIVLMGMGEPFHNYDNTMAAIDRLNDPDGYAFGARRFTISTVGLVSKIRQFADEKRQVNLAISLHAAEDEERGKIMPVNKRNNISKLLEACRYYVDQTGRRITFEWALISGVNDTEEVARKLASRLKGLMCHVNAIPLNPTTGYRRPGDRPSAGCQVQRNAGAGRNSVHDPHASGN